MAERAQDDWLAAGERLEQPGLPAETLRLMAESGAQVFRFRAMLRSVVWAVLALSIFITALALLWRASNGWAVNPGVMAGWVGLALGVLLLAPKEGGK